jgi:hypothetical protein
LLAVRFQHGPDGWLRAPVYTVEDATHDAIVVGLRYSVRLSTLSGSRAKVRSTLGFLLCVELLGRHTACLVPG